MSNGVSWANQYDAADQLTAAAISDQVTTAMLTNNAFAYDRVGNRLSKQQNSSVVGGTFNNLNQLTSLTGGNGQLQINGSVSKTSKVTIQSGTNSYPATTLWGTNFAANIPAMLGSNTFAVVAQDANTNLVTNTYQIDVTALEESKSFIYDANGNCLNDGFRTYTWDAANRLASVTQGTNTYAFGYDFAGRRVSEKLNGTLIKQTLWDSAGSAPTPLEERSASNTVTKRFFAQGEVQGGTNYFYMRDHLGSVRELVNGSGQVIAEATYDPYGVATVSGTVIPTFQYAGYYAHQGSGLNLTWYRSYDPVIGRWQARDPLPNAERLQGMNLYEYVKNRPINLWDPLGLQSQRGYVPPGRPIGPLPPCCNVPPDIANTPASAVAGLPGDLNWWLELLQRAGFGHQPPPRPSRCPNKDASPLYKAIYDAQHPVSPYGEINAGSATGDNVSK